MKRGKVDIANFLVDSSFGKQLFGRCKSRDLRDGEIYNSKIPIYKRTKTAM